MKIQCIKKGIKSFHEELRQVMFFNNITHVYSISSIMIQFYVLISIRLYFNIESDNIFSYLPYFAHLSKNIEGQLEILLFFLRQKYMDYIHQIFLIIYNCFQHQNNNVDQQQKIQQNKNIQKISSNERTQQKTQILYSSVLLLMINCVFY
ncbi:unnamed protein product [Paramecium octaurelia]|uniref:Transmembrane protein n=1 Tax=Paramecium octaurelia TaxID=43137 RepID=A0A8S1W6E9_PAROT|nr:unnamed protein product [Paramecium octaurelia]